jgi:hypothetical protein
MGKMVKRAFPEVRTKRSGPRGRVTQYYLGLRRSVVVTSDPRPVDRSDDTTTVPQPAKEEVCVGDVLDLDPGSSGSCEWSVANPCADPQQQHITGHDDWAHHLQVLERDWDSTFTPTTTLGCWTTSAAGEGDQDLELLLAWADTLAAQDEDALLLLAPDVCPSGHS